MTGEEMARKPEEHIFFIGREDREGKQFFLSSEDGSVLVFEAEEDAFRFLRQMKNVPDDAGVGLGTIDIAREFAGEHGGLVELVAAGDDEPSVIIRP